MTKILVIDDHPIHRRLLADELVGLGYEVQRAKDIETANAALATFEPDLVLADLVLRGNRFEVIDWVHRLRGEPAHAGLKILFVTAHHEEMQRSVEHIADSALLCKPFTFEQVHTKIRQML